MLQICKQDNEKVLESIRSGHIDAANLSFPNLTDSIVLAMKRHKILEPLTDFLVDKRSRNKHIPFEILLTISIAAKLKLKTSLTDVPFAISDAELLSELGWNIWDTDRNIEEGLFSESVMRKLISKYESSEWLSFYNNYVQKGVLSTICYQPTVHILDCTKVPVNLKNSNYEKSSVVKIDGESIRGYKLGVLRGLMDDSGVAEEIVLGTLKTHDMELCRKLLKETPCLKENDILINDRGFLSRDMINDLKTRRMVDTYVPAKKNMSIYEDAVRIAKDTGKWTKHPNSKRKTQTIQLITDLGYLWTSDHSENDVPLNGCVVRDEKNDSYYVFLTTDLRKTARQIINIYELRPEIEEDFRQMKDFWKLADFKSTQYNYISFHIVMTLIGYLYFQVYKNLDEGKKYIRKSLPVVCKNHRETKPKSVVVYAGQYFGIFSFLKFMQLYADCTLDIRRLLDPILDQA